jgi:hypothetical protein
MAEQAGTMQTVRHPAPHVLADPARLHPALGWVATAEEYIPGGEIGSTDAGLPARHAALAAELIQFAPAAETLADQLDPPVTWLHWDHDRPGTWGPHEKGGDVIPRGVPGWLETAGRFVRERLQGDQSRLVVVHGDLEIQNTPVTSDGMVHVVHDWVSACVRRELFWVGATAAVYTNVKPDHPRTDATIEQTDEFLDAYQAATGRSLTAEELEVCWAGGVWELAYNAARDHSDGAPGVLELLDPTGQLIQRMHNAGAPASVIAQMTGA